MSDMRGSRKEVPEVSLVFFVQPRVTPVVASFCKMMKCTT